MHHSLRNGLLIAVSALALAACGQANDGADASIEAMPPPAVETPLPQDWTKGGMAAAADARAVDAALEVLNEGGHAVDAAIALHAVLGLVEPQSSGIGGGAFMLVYDRANDEITVYDGRETAPAAATPDIFMRDGEALGFIEAWQSGRSVGVPGQIALYKAAHDDFGQLDWGRNFDAAISLAADGWEVSPRVASVLENERLRRFIRLDDNPDTAAYFYPDGEPLPAGFVRTNPDYAATLRAVAAEGPSAFYTGAVAENIVAAVNAEPLGGSMTLEDLAGYEVVKRDAVCGTVRTYKICSAPPPSSGGITQNMIFGLYDRLLNTRQSETEELSEINKVATFVDAQRLSYADRDHYVADADFVTVPTDDLINAAYLDARAQQVFAPDEPSTPGDPGEVLRGEPMITMWGQDPTEDAPGTTHLSIIDKDGNAVSMTATIEAAFGASRWANGFLLNNELTDFSFEPTKNGKPVANAVEGGKRPRSSMSPTMIFNEDGELFMLTGSPGGNSIVAYVSKTIMGVLDWGLSAQEAAGLPNVIARGDRVGVEVDRGPGQAWADELKAMGYDVIERRGENSGLHLIIVREDGLEGGADPRREGVAKPTADISPEIDGES